MRRHAAGREDAAAGPQTGTPVGAEDAGRSVRSGWGPVVAVASIVTVAFAGSVIVTPLYPLWQRAFGFSDITLTLVYATYVVGNVLALLLFGQVSDQVGRKRVALVALALGAVSALLFLSASGTAWLYLGRLLIGLSVGVASGTGTAWLTELFGPARRAAATIAAAIANLTGIALGPLLGGLLAQYTSRPLTLPFVAYVVALVAVAIAVARTRETRRTELTPLTAVRVHPRVGVPREVLGAFAAPAVTAFVIFALAGLYFALIPAIVIKDLHVTSVAVGGLVVCELGTVAVLVTVVGRRLPPVTAMRSAMILLLPAAALVVAAQGLGSMPLLLVASALAGATLALGYRGSLQVVNQIAPDERRAEVVSSYYLACFIGNSVPVIGLGVLAIVVGALPAGIVFAATIAVLSLAALAWSRRSARPHDTTRRS